MKEYITWKERSQYGDLIKEYIDLDISPGIIIGRGGKIIQEIERTTNAKVRILREENKILISGYKQDYINNAINEISKIVENYKKRINNKYYTNSDNDYESEKESERMNFLDDNDFPPIQSNSSININNKSIWDNKPNIFKN